MRQQTTMSMEGGEEPDLGEDTETSKRSERKRQREKQRRSDLSHAFEELSAFILQVEPNAPDADGVDPKKKRKKSGDGGDESSGITRLDLVSRALRVMKKLHRENEQNKRIIASMREREMTSNHNDNVLVMLPTLTPAHEEQYPVARATYPSYPPAHHHPHHPYYQGGHAASGLPQPPAPPPPLPPPVPEYNSGGMTPQGRHQPYSPSEWSRYGRHHPPPPGYNPRHSPPDRGQPPPPGASPEGQGRGETERR